MLKYHGWPESTQPRSKKNRGTYGGVFPGSPGMHVSTGKKKLPSAVRLLVCWARARPGGVRFRTRPGMTNGSAPRAGGWAGASLFASAGCWQPVREQEPWRGASESPGHSGALIRQRGREAAVTSNHVSPTQFAFWQCAFLGKLKLASCVRGALRNQRPVFPAQEAARVGQRGMFPS